MVTVKSNKFALGVRVSGDIYKRVKALTEGDDPDYESIADYLNFVIAQDLARRELGVDYITQKFLELLENPEIQKIVREKLK